jgi:hypothetical protein
VARVISHVALPDERAALLRFCCSVAVSDDTGAREPQGSAHGFVPSRPSSAYIACLASEFNLTPEQVDHHSAHHRQPKRVRRPLGGGGRAAVLLLQSTPSPSVSRPATGHRDAAGKRLPDSRSYVAKSIGGSASGLQLPRLARERSVQPAHPDRRCRRAGHRPRAQPAGTLGSPARVAQLDRATAF